GRGDAGLGEQLLVVEEHAGGGGERHAVLHTVDPARLGQLGDEVGLDGYGEQVVGAVEEALGGVGGVGADLRHVRRIARVDHLLDLAVDVVPGVDVGLDPDAGVVGLVLVDQGVPVLAGAVGGRGAVVGGDQVQGDVGGAGAGAAAA